MIVRPKPKQKFVPIIKDTPRSGQQAGRRLYDEHGEPFVCEETNDNRIAANDGVVENYRGKPIPCRRIFTHELFRFEIVE